MKNPIAITAFSALLVASLFVASPSRAEPGRGVEHIKVAPGHLLFEIVGNVINFTPTTSTQFGYYTFIKGIDSLFTTGAENEATAVFTFVRETSNVRVTVNGPLRIVSRVGTTTAYLNATPNGNFANPASFRTGTPILTSVLRQQVVVNTVTQSFTVMNHETITSTSAFSVNQRRYEIGKVGDVYVTTKSGHSNVPGATPSGWFGGYSLGAEKSENSN